MSAPTIDRYAVLGHPVEHSKSPFIHERFAAQTAQALTYGRIPCAPGTFADTVRAFAAAGGRGVNVTVPFKFEAPGLATRLSERARLAGAANTLRFDAEGWSADNTDGVGLVDDITRGAGVPLAGARVLLIGAGGASAGVLGPLLAGAPAELVVANRSPDRAHELVARHQAWAARHGTALRASGLADCGRAFDLVVNGSASSLAGGGIPVADEVLRPGTLAVDMMYGPAAQPFLDWAAAHDAVGRDGLGMLVAQAAEAFHFWRGVRPDPAPVLAALRAHMQG
jgi:shikimate dehydrogenase